MPYKTKEERNDYLKKFIASHPGYRRNSALKRNYGITVLEYGRLYQIQSGKCKICGRHQTELKTRLCVDHDHKTGKIRGLLCRRCNLVLGVYENNTKDFSAYLGG